MLAAPLLALALGATGSWQFGLRGEVRGVGGVPSDLTVPQPSPYEVAPSLSFALEYPPTLVVRAAYSPRFVLLSGPAGGYAVDSASQYHEGALSAAWRATRQLQLYFSGSASIGFLEVSPLGQLSPRQGTTDAPTPPGLPGSTDPNLQPGAGMRTARYSSVSGGTGFDWQAGYRWTLGATALFTRSGGLTPEARDVFPLQNGLVAESHASYAVDPQDKLTLRLGASRTIYPQVSTAEVYGLAVRWDHRWTSHLTGHAGAGLATSSDSSNPNPPPLSRRLAPHLEAGLQQSAPERGRGVGLGLFASYEPNVDPYTNQVLQRAQIQADLSWKPWTSVGLTAGTAAATTIQSGQVGPSVYAGNLGVWWRDRQTDVGLVARVGYQEHALPLLAPWEWGVALVVVHRGKTTL